MARRHSLWRHHDFLHLWGAQAVSLTGTQVTALALPAIAILSLRATPLEVGVLAALPWVAFLLLGLPAGVFVDRLSRRRLMVLSDLLRAAALGAIPLTFWLGRPSLLVLYAAGALVGIGNVFFELASTSFLPYLLESADLVEGNSKLAITEGAASIGGPALGGALIGAFGGAFAIVADVVSYVVSATLLSRIPTREPSATERAWPSARQMGREIREGIVYLLQAPTVLTLAAVSGLQNLGDSMASAMLLVLLYRTLHLAPSPVGLALTVGSVGFVIGAMIAAPVTRRLGVGRLLLVSSVCGATAYLLLPAAVWGAPLLWVIGTRILYGLHIPTYNVNVISLRQAIVPDQIQGRLNAATRTIAFGALSIGPLLGGALGAWWGPAPTIFVGGLIFLGGSLLIGLPAVFSYRTLPQTRSATTTAREDVPVPVAVGLALEPVETCVCES
jgi:MFS family permease